MARLNRVAAELAREYGVRAMTDITGFGLAGHALEMARLSGVDFVIDYAKLKLLPGADEYARRGVFPGGMARNLEYFAQWVDANGQLPEHAGGLLYDPQTSGRAADGGGCGANRCLAR